jgi:two-component system, NtrC family, nitrogen regulation response regulator GlnG
MSGGERGGSSETLGVTTLDPSGAVLLPSLTRSELVATIVYHADLGRVGERAVLGPPERVRQGVSRLEPLFAQPGSTERRPLGDPRVSRSPWTLRSDGDGVVLTCEGDAPSLLVDGVAESRRRLLTARDLERGVLLAMGTRLLLLLHMVSASSAVDDDCGLVGSSDAIAAVRRKIVVAAPHDVPVLVRGQSGVGKELVARAVHERSARAGRPFVSVNVAAVASTTAVAALFGHRRGAFTGAGEAHGGYFGAADGGTLFLDEIGAAPEELQNALLRVLETGEMQPVGAPTPQRCDVRLVAATDADLEREVDSGRFRLALLMRLAGFEIEVPPLAARADDIARLLVHFLRTEVGARGALDHLDRPAGAPAWLPSWVVAAALGHRWPGNVRELRNFARRIVLEHAADDVVPRTPELVAMLGDAQEPTAADPPAPLPAAPARRKPSDIGDDELCAALARSDYDVGAAAEVLGVARSTVYELVKKSASARTSADLGADEIRAALEQAGGDAVAAARTLRVSSRALQLRMAALGLR